MSNKRKTLTTTISVIVFIILGVTCGILLSSIEIKDMDLSETVEDYSNGDITAEYSNGDIVYSPNESDLSYDEDSYTLYYDNLLIVYTLTDMSEADAESLATQVGGTIVGDISGAVNALQIKVASTNLESLNAYADILMESDQVLYASYEIPMAASDNTTEDQNPWSDGAAIADKNEDTPSGNDWWAEAIDAYSAWEYVDNNSDAISNVTVGILDSGFDTDHEDLGNISVINENSAEDHGTHVAGIIAAQNNTTGIRGIADGATLLCADWSVETSTENDATETENFLSTGEWIELTKELIEEGASVINNSWGLYYYSESGFAELLYDADNKNNEASGWDYLAQMIANGYFGTYDAYSTFMSNYASRSSLQCISLLLELMANTEGKDFLIVQAAGNGYDNSEEGYAASQTGFYCAVTEENYNILPESTRAKIEGLGYSYPKFKDHILIVGATRNERNTEGYYLLSMFSNYGSTVDICAPGENIYSSLSLLDDGKDQDNDGNPYNDATDGLSYGNLSGTSMAAPMVSGAAALIWSINPSLTAAEVKNIMLENCSMAMGVTGEDAGVAYPMLNVGLAVRAAVNTVESIVSEADQMTDATEQDTTVSSESENIFSEMPSDFSFMTGDGHMWIDLTINDDGSFTGEYINVSYLLGFSGDVGDEYPNGTEKICNFSGMFSTPEKEDDYIYTMKIESFETEIPIGDVYYEDGIRYICELPYDSYDTEMFTIYLPGCVLSSINETVLQWQILKQFYIGSEDTVLSNCCIIFDMENQDVYIGDIDEESTSDSDDEDTENANLPISEENLREVLSAYTDEDVLNFIYDDFDYNGTYEAIAFCGKWSEEEGYYGTLYFVSEKGVSVICEGGYWTAGDVFDFGDAKIIYIAGYLTTGSIGYYYEVNGESVSEITGSGQAGTLYVDSDGRYCMRDSQYDAYVDGTGHTWNVYYFYWNDGLKEYGGTQISESDFLNYDGAAAILEKIQGDGYSVTSIYMRENGIMNINACDGVQNVNVRVKYENECVESYPTDSEYGYYESGIIYAALIPEIAVYGEAISSTETETVIVIE